MEAIPWSYIRMEPVKTRLHHLVTLYNEKNYASYIE